MKKIAIHDTVIVLLLMGNSFIGKHKILTGTIVILFILFGVLYAVYSYFVVWEDESTVTLKETISVAPNPTAAAAPTGSSDKLPEVIVKGRITVTVTKENKQPFTDAVVVLKTDKGKSLKEIKASGQGVVVFDEVAAGTYTIETHRMGDGRVASKKISLAEGEVTQVSLSLFLDTEVKITVHVKNPDGSTTSDKSFTLTKNGGPTSNVSTNSEGVFNATVSPDDNWRLMIGDKEVGTFKVSPTGASQVINVTTSSN